MSALNERRSGDEPSIKYRWNQDAEISYELAELVHQDSNNNDKKSSRANVHESAEILSTSQLISRACQVWDVARRPLSFFHPKSTFNIDERACPNELIFGNYAEKGSNKDLNSSEKRKNGLNLGNSGHFTTLVLSNFSSFSVSQKISAFVPCTDERIQSSFQKDLLSGKRLSGIEVFDDIKKRYECMGGLYDLARVTESKCCTIGELVDTASEVCVSGNIDELTCETDLKRSDPSSVLDLEISEEEKSIKSKSPLASDYFLNSVHDSETNGNIDLLRISSIYADYHINPLPYCEDPFEKFGCEDDDDDDLPECKERPAKNFIIDDKCKREILVPSHERFHNSFAKQEHAFAGALAGTCVSLCLHPVDTIKTVVQSCRAEKSSITFIGKSIISDRGLFGLYRGIVTNIASSAPISAVYTFTYESVKGSLLPLLPREYYSFAHCVAGGCASVATSFIFTPSERIKQQMQVSSNYPNCWNALIEIVRKGGFSSLYTGWGAVLCRNIPHSIIKFYTYESLKEMIIPSEQFDARPSTSQTLVCGGVAGSTAALFTTPFDVVKTRLQTQIPGSKSQYHNVIHALQEIGKKEGLKGLYRGLTPRLVMYMSQGAIFFASYEFFRRCLWLEVLKHS